MTHPLSNLLRSLGIPFEESLSGRWVKILSQPYATYVVQGWWEHSYLTWCDRWDEREVERYATPEEAVTAGLRRASQPLKVDDLPNAKRELPSDTAG